MAMSQNSKRERHTADGDPSFERVPQRRSGRPPGARDWRWFRPRVRRLSDLRGMAVVDLAQARRVGFVEEVVLDPHAGRLGGLAVGPVGEFPERQVAGHQLRHLGRHAIVVLTPRDAAEDPVPTDDERVLNLQAVLGLEVLTDHGDLVGYLSDVYLDPDTLAVQAYELRTPFWERWLGRRRLVLPHQVLVCSRELMIVPEAERDGVVAGMGAEPEADTASWPAASLQLVSPEEIERSEPEPRVARPA